MDTLENHKRKTPLSLSMLTPLQAVKLKQRLLEKTIEVKGGCRVSITGHTGAVQIGGHKPLTYPHIAWLLAHGTTPTYRLKTECRTVGCCNPDHLHDCPPRQIRKARDHWRHMTDDEKQLALHMYEKQRLRLQDIGDAIGVSAQTIHKLIRKERGMSRE